MTPEIESSILAGIRQDYLLFLALVGAFHFVLMAVGTTFSNRAEVAGRRLFLGLAAAGSCITCLLLVELTAFVSALDSAALGLAGDILRFLAAAALLSSGCALSPRFSGRCAAMALVGIGLLSAGLAAVFGVEGFTVGTGIGMIGASLGLVVHILRFRGGKQLPEGSLLPLAVAAGAFSLIGIDALVREHASWMRIEPWLVLPALAPWVAGLALWVFSDGVRPIAQLREIRPPRRLFSLWFFPAIQAAILMLGWAATEILSRPATGHAREHLDLKVRSAVAAINPGTLNAYLGGSLGADSTAGRALQHSLDTIREETDSVESAFLWRTRSNERVLLKESRTADGPAFSLPVKPTAREIEGILAGVATVAPLRTLDNETRFLASAPVFAQYPDRVIGWLSLGVHPDEFVRMITASRTGLMVVVGLLSILGTGLFALFVRGQIEDDLRIGMEKAEVADRAKSEFLAIMSHEIRTPLQSVLGYTDLVIDTPLDDAQRQQIQLIRSQGRTLMRIVQDILDFSAMTRGGFSLRLKPVLLKSLIDEVVATLSPVADRKGLRFECSISDQLPARVVSDGVRLRQVLFNVIGNAIKYTPRGQVTFEVRAEPSALPPADSEKERATVVFRIADTGPGIPDHARKRLFEPFFRSDTEFTGEEGGAGLGLAIVRRLCELMGATVRVESEVGRGTTVEIRAPFEVNTSDTTTMESVLPSRDPEDDIGTPVLAWELPLSVLLVEDNSFIRGLFVDYLKKIGYQADVVDNGRDAVAACLQTPYDLILMDLKLPELSGPEATRQIRKIAGDDEHPWIIGLSASTRDEDINEAMEAGMNDFLAKPVNLRGLVETILFSPLGKGVSGENGGMDPVALAGDSADDWTTIAGGPSRERAWALFVRETPALIDEMRNAHQAGDLLRVRNRAHYLKNSGLYLKDTSLVELCETICRDATGARHKEVGLGLDSLEWLVVSMITSEAMA